MLAGVQFGVYSDAGCTQKLCELTTGSDGTVTSGTLPAGTVYVKELSTVSPYVIDNAAKTVTISINKTTMLNVENITAKGQICINKTAEQMTDAVESSSDYGTVYSPKYTETCSDIDRPLCRPYAHGRLFCYCLCTDAGERRHQ